MALRQTVELKDSFGDNRTFSNAYRKVKTFTGTKERILVTVETYRSKEDQRVLVATGYDFVPNMNAGNFIAQAYEYLKTLPEFLSATDC